MKHDYKKAMYLWETEIFLEGDDEPRYVNACVFEDGETIDYGGSPISWLDVDWEKTNELWESRGYWPLNLCSFEENVRVDFVNGSWKLISEEEDAKFDDEDDDFDDENDNAYR